MTIHTITQYNAYCHIVAIRFCVHSLLERLSHAKQKQKQTINDKEGQVGKPKRHFGKAGGGPIGQPALPFARDRQSLTKFDPCLTHFWDAGTTDLSH